MPTYNAHENGTRGIGRAYFEYANTFKVNPAWLLGHSDERDVFTAGVSDHLGNMYSRIRELRKRAGLTQDVLANLIGDGAVKMTISRLESGKTRLTVDMMKKLAEALQCSPTDLLPVATLPGLDEVQLAADDAFASMRSVWGALASKGLRVYTLTEAGTSIVEVGIRPGEPVVVEETEAAINGVKTGDVVLVRMANGMLALR